MFHSTSRSLDYKFVTTGDISLIVNCTWVILAEATEFIDLNFLYINVQNSSSCELGSVKVKKQTGVTRKCQNQGYEEETKNHVTPRTPLKTNDTNCLNYIFRNNKENAKKCKIKIKKGYIYKSKQEDKAQ